MFLTFFFNFFSYLNFTISEHTFSIFLIVLFLFIFFLLPPPLSTRFYTQFNLILLTFLSCKKNIFHLHSFLLDFTQQSYSLFSFSSIRHNEADKCAFERDYRAYMQLASLFLSTPSQCTFISLFSLPSLSVGDF